MTCVEDVRRPLDEASSLLSHMALSGAYTYDQLRVQDLTLQALSALLLLAEQDHKINAVHRGRIDRLELAS